LIARPDSGASTEKPNGLNRDALVADALAKIADALAALSSALAPPAHNATDGVTRYTKALRDPDSPGGVSSDRVTHRGAPLPGPSHFAPDPSLTVGDAVNAFIVHKANMGKSPETLRYLQACLKSFCKGRFNAPLQAVTVSDLQTWIDGFDRRKTKTTYLGAVRTLLRWAMRKNWLTADLTRAVEIADDEEEEREPDPYTPAEAQKLLNHLRETNIDLCRIFALRFFTGLRTCEIKRLTEAEILESGYIKVTRAMSKTRRQRMVKILPNLQAWLALGGEVRGVAECTVREAFKEAEVPKRANGTRSSFITYHLALWENVNQTANQAGNTREMIEAHYKGLVTQEAAQEYWNIFPSVEPVAYKPRLNPGWFQKGRKKTGGPKKPPCQDSGPLNQNAL